MIRLQRHLLGASALAGALGLLTAAPALAQSTPEAPIARTNSTPAAGAPGATNSAVSGQDKTPDAPSANNNVATDGTGVSEVVVTGSRIKRNDLTSAQPIQVIGGAYLDEKGFLNVADALNQLPGVQGSTTPTGDQASFGTGRSYINLFNLGSGRTLTLLNGRRFITDNPAIAVGGLAAGAQTDTNAIPTAFIDRIETVQAGGSAIYGSDAIAGVINIITKDKFKGFEADAQYGRSDRDDFPQYRARVAAGFDFLGGRGNLAATFEFVRTSALFASDRPETTGQNYAFATNPRNVNGTDGIPATVLISGRTVPEVSPGGVPFRINTSSLAQLLSIPDPNNPGARVPAQFGPGGVLIPYQTGQFYSASVASGGDGLNLASVTSLQTPNDRYIVGGIGSFEITPHIRAHAEFQASRVNGREPANQPIYNSAIFAGTACVAGGACPATANSGNLGFSITNPFLPASTVAQLQAQNVTTFFLSRGSQDLVQGSNPIESIDETLRGVISFDGDFNVFGRDFNWNVFYNHGQSSGEFDNVQIDQQKFVYAINAVRDASGAIVCGTPSAALGGVNAPRFAGCQPLNLFGNGSPSAAAVGYVSQLFSSRFVNEEDNAEANLSGTVIRLPGGPVAFNVGYEYRRESAKFSPDPASSAGLGRSVATVGSNGAFHTNEVYSEVSVPFFGEGFSFPLMRALEFDFSDREVFNSLAGDGRAYSYQGKYRPFKDLLIRATRSRSFRAPTVSQLFGPQSSAFSTATDPCDRRSINAGANPAVRAANCLKAFQALGLGSTDLAGFTSLVQDRTSPIITGGNLSLGNETAEQYSYGFVYQPKFIPNLVVSADLVNVRIVGAISNFTLTSILSTCYDQPSQPVDVCSRFSRNAQGQINDNAVTGLVNAGYLRFQALNVNMSYDFEPRYIPGFESLPGRIGLNLVAENYERYESSVSGTGLDIVRSAGTFGVPRWAGTLNVSYVNGPFRSILTERYTSSTRYNNTFTPESQSILSVGDYLLSDFTASYKFRNFTARAGVNNIFDVEPPFPSTSSVYDLIGRYYFVGLNAKF